MSFQWVQILSDRSLGEPESKDIFSSPYVTTPSMQFSQTVFSCSFAYFASHTTSNLYLAANSHLGHFLLRAYNKTSFLDSGMADEKSG
jgi:hypothetical protein